MLAHEFYYGESTESTAQPRGLEELGLSSHAHTHTQPAIHSQPEEATSVLARVNAWSGETATAAATAAAATAAAVKAVEAAAAAVQAAEAAAAAAAGLVLIYIYQFTRVCMYVCMYVCVCVCMS